MNLQALFFVTVLGFAGVASAQEGLHTSIHKHYQAPRALGMGGAFVAVANDYSSIFYNPAGLARLDQGQFNGSIDIGVSGQQFTNFLKEIDEASKIEDDDAQFTAMVEVLQRNYGKQFSVRLGLLNALYVRPNWGIALLPADFTLDMKIHNQATPAINVRAYLDTTLAYAYGQAFRDENIPGKFSWGVTTKFVNRGYANKVVNALDLAADSKVVSSKDLRDGYTVDFDLGLLYTPYVGGESWLRYSRPTFGLVVRNVLDYGFNKSFDVFNKEDTEAPERLYRTIDLGSRFEMPSFSIFGWRAVLDVQDLMHPNYSTRKSLHMGAEFDWTVTSWWKGQYRIGVNQGYPTMGASFLLAAFRLDLVTYGEDVGSSNDPAENRMFRLNLNLDI